MQTPLLEVITDSQVDSPQNKLEYRYKSHFVDKLTFGWIHPLMQYSSKDVISQDLLQDLSVQQQSQSIYYKWNDYWKEQKKNNTKDPLLQSIKDTFKKNYFKATVFDFLAYQFSIITPLLIYFAAHYLLDKRQMKWSIFYILLIPLVRFLRSFCDAHGSFHLNLLGTEISNSVSIGMVNKAMRYSTLCNKKFKTGQITNLMQADCFRLSLLPKNFNTIIFISYCLIFSMIFMGIIVGYAFLAGFAVIFFVSVLNMIISRFTTQYQKKFAKATDERMKTTSEVFNNIKYIKVNAWQQCFYDKLMTKRTEQVGWLRKKCISQSFSTFSMWLAPKFILAATYGVYVATGGSLNPQTTFSIMSLFGYIQFYLQFLPNSISIVIECFNSLKRIQKFLLSDQIDISCITYDRFDLPTKQIKLNAIEMKNGNFYWNKDFEAEQEDRSESRSRQGSLLSLESERKELDLLDLNFSIRKGDMVAIIGCTGSGKSSLLYSLLGEMKFKGRPQVTVNGTMSLVTQKPWIMNDTVKNNIIFGQRFDSVRYKEVLKYACLERDLQLFTKGDQTMIGEKGATLSGGQKARISLARALYSNSDIFLLDDLLSAVDVHVGKFIMTQTLLSYLRSKTRILVTHSLHYLKYMDKILILEEGQLVEQGNNQTIKKGERFKQMYERMKKDGKRKGVSLHVDSSQNQIIEEVNEEQDQLIQDELMREASIHSNQSRSRSGIDHSKLQALRSKKSRILQNKQKQKEPRADKLSSESLPQNSLMLVQRMNQGKSVLQLYKDYVKYNLGYGFIAFIGLVQILWMASNSFSNLWLIWWTDQSDGANDEHSMNYYIGIYVLIGFLYALFALIRALLIAYSGPKMSTQVHESIISSLLFSSLYDFFDRVPLGRIFNILSKDLSSVDINLSVYFNSALVFIFLLGSNIVVISFLAPIYVFWPIILVYIIICYFLRRYYSKPAKELTKLEGISKSPILSCFGEILQGVSSIRCFKKQNMFIIASCLKIDENKKPIMTRKAVEVWFTFRLMLCSLLINFSSLVYLFFFRDPSPKHASEAALFMVVTLGFDQIMYLLFSNLGTFQSQLNSLERCQLFMNIEPQKGYKQYLKNREELKERSKIRRKMKAQGWPNQGRIQLIDYKCRYRHNLEFVLKGLNVVFEGGEKIGVVGRTGSGKSTLMMSLLRVLQASEGKIVIDDRDISHLSLDDLRSKITIILQDPCLFAGTIRENLDPLGEYSDDQLISALEKCQLIDILDQRQMLETEISENGDNLSVGERQLVSIARAILNPCRVVLIDEATANIDVGTQSIISRVMNDSFKRSTVLTIAHRLNTVMGSDRIVVLQGGELKQTGRPGELLQSPISLFSELNSQLQRQKTT